jgi:hypothetical protein
MCLSEVIWVVVVGGGGANTRVGATTLRVSKWLPFNVRAEGTAVSTASTPLSLPVCLSVLLALTYGPLGLEWWRKWLRRNPVSFRCTLFIRPYFEFPGMEDQGLNWQSEQNCVCFRTIRTLLRRQFLGLKYSIHEGHKWMCNRDALTILPQMLSTNLFKGIRLNFVSNIYSREVAN